MINAAAGYANSVSSPYNYNYNAVRSVSSDYNNAGANRANSRQSYINNDAVRYVARIQANAGNMLDSLDSVSNISTSGKMWTAYNEAVNTSRNDGYEAQTVREREPERTENARNETAGADEMRTTFERIDGETAAQTQAARTEAAADANTSRNTSEGTGGANAAGNANDDFAGAVRDMAGSYNGLLEAAEAGPRDNRLLNDLRDTAADYAASLRQIGITVSENGSLAIDENRLAGAGRTGALEETFAVGGGNSGFANQLTRIAEGVMGNRPAYEQQAVRSGPDTAQNSATRAANNAVENYRRSVNNYDYAYGYSTPGTLFNLYA